MGPRVNAKTINLTSARPQHPIKFIYIFTLRPAPLKRLCLDISEQPDMSIYLTGLSQRTRSRDQFTPTGSESMQMHFCPPDNTANLEAAMHLGLCSIIPRWFVIEIMSVWSLTNPNESFSATQDVAYSTVIRSSKNSIHFTVKNTKLNKYFFLKKQR